MDLTTFQALSFDCYGTLIDWETGIAAVLSPWAREQGLDLSDEDLLLAYGTQEAAVEVETPSALYPDVLATRSATSGRSGWARRCRTGRRFPIPPMRWHAWPLTTS